MILLYRAFLAKTFFGLSATGGRGDGTPSAEGRSDGTPSVRLTRRPAGVGSRPLSTFSKIRPTKRAVPTEFQRQRRVFTLIASVPRRPSV
ncbi:hypothetical protein niasHT_024025 [Heterodera trifolii]|uniref:Secreted protein n=1 Tax=Heterodera trifolii TaxID=157864 RepID=A0ABD2KPK5_9BILA